MLGLNMLELFCKFFMSATGNCTSRHVFFPFGELVLRIHVLALYLLPKPVDPLYSVSGMC